MSVNLHIRFEIRNISDLHIIPDDPLKKELVKQAENFLRSEDILDQGMVVDFIGENGYLSAYTTYPLIISGSYKWVPYVTDGWKALAHRVMGPECQPSVTVDYPDED